MDMPQINLAEISLSDVDRKIAEKILRSGKLRASKPKDGEAQYVWRLVAFMISPVPAHHCMPTTHDFGVMDIAPKVTKFCKYRNKDVNETDMEWVRNRCKELDKIVDAIVDSVKVQNRHGVNRWARAFGVI